MPDNDFKLTAEDDENPTWTAADFATAVPFKEAEPELHAAWKRTGGRPTIHKVPKVHLAFRLSADVVAHLKASGKGYGARVDDVLRNAIAKGLL